MRLDPDTERNALLAILEIGRREIHNGAFQSVEDVFLELDVEEHIIKERSEESRSD
ncbi:hypothetical protein [Pseudomonas sp. W2-17]|uniref:hypothetical protein n=1 Tax=Pseudomonas sp. W2-17 TaxID=3058039 RepID=UPI0034E0611F